MELHFTSQNVEQRLFQLFPSKILVVQSLSEDGRCLYLQPELQPAAGLQPSRKANVQVADATSSLMVPGTLKKADPKEAAEGQSQQANSDVNKPTDLSLPKSQQKSTKSDVSSKQGSGPSNLSASQKSKVSGMTSTSESAQPESHHGSSGGTLGQLMFEQETPAGDSKTVTPLSTKLEMELTWKKKHTVHCFLHHFEVKCNLCETAEECQEYDEGFAIMFGQFLDKDPNASLPSANNEDTPGVDFLKYIKAHLQAEKCPSLCYRLWRYCLNNKLFSLFKYAPEGLLIHSDNQQNAVGTVINTYLGYRDKNLKMIGSGGFGKVYEFCDEKAVKEELKQPLINGSTLLFQRIMELDHPHVIKVLEYIAGPGEDQNKCFLSVMPFKNQKDLQKQFTKENLTCVLDYMTEFPNQKKFIFRNYTLLFRHVFEGLCYLKSQGIIHRDIKPSNILVHQNCTCQSPLQCMCASDGNVTYLLGDMDLFSLEEDSADLIYTLDEWEKMAYHDPAGTIGMKPPESFFRTKKGDRVTNHKSDVWSACVTMMNVLISKTVNDEAQKQIKLFITAATEGAKAALKSVTKSLDLLGSIITHFKSVLNQMKKVQGYSELVNNDMRDLNVHLNKLKQLLTSGEMGLHQSQSFQGGFSEVYKEENPLAGILTTAHGAQVLHWKCLSKLKEKEIHDTQLWTVMEEILNAIVAGIKFVPDKRKDATEILNCLMKIPSLDCSCNE